MTLLFISTSVPAHASDCAESWNRYSWHVDQSIGSDFTSIFVFYTEIYLVQVETSVLKSCRSIIYATFSLLLFQFQFLTPFHLKFILPHPDTWGYPYKFFATEILSVHWVMDFFKATLRIRKLFWNYLTPCAITVITFSPHVHSGGVGKCTEVYLSVKKELQYQTDPKSPAQPSKWQNYMKEAKV